MIKTKAIVFGLDEFSEWLQKITDGNADMVVDGGECCMVGSEDIDLETEVYEIMGKNLNEKVTDIIADSNNFKVAVVCE